GEQLHSVPTGRSRPLRLARRGRAPGATRPSAAPDPTPRQAPILSTPHARTSPRTQNQKKIPHYPPKNPPFPPLAARATSKSRTAAPFYRRSLCARPTTQPHHSAPPCLRISVTH